MKTIKKCITAALGSFIVGIGVALNQRARLGNDPVGIFYDGIRALFRLTDSQLGTVTFAVNLILICLVLFISRKYLSLGTIIFFVFYGTSVQLGGTIYDILALELTLLIQIITSVIGCLGIYIGVALFIVADIGYDPMTGLAMIISDTFKWPFGRGKILFDLILLISGALMGGKLGVITVIMALTAGPIIQRVAGVINKSR